MDRDSKHQRIEWAKAYPFDVPDRSYIYMRPGHHMLAHYRHDAWHEARVERGDRVVALHEVAGKEALDELILHRRHTVVACGSNASPQRLAQKYGQGQSHEVVPTLRVTLHNHTIVYAANFTSYGSVPATLAYTPGAKVHAFINLLTDEQLGIMDETETYYERLYLPAQSVELENGTKLDEAYAYLSVYGCLSYRGSPVALSSVQGEGIPHKKMDQVGALSLAQALLGAPGHLDDFIHENIMRADLRRSRGRKLKDHHSVPAHPSNQD